MDINIEKNRPSKNSPPQKHATNDEVYNVSRRVCPFLAFS